MNTPFDRNDVKDLPSSTEDSAERGYVRERQDIDDPETYAEVGRSETVDFEDEGDIADEGRGHRG